MTQAEIKAAVRQRDGLRCTECGMTNADHIQRYGFQLEVHRTIPRSLYTLEGCVTLCRACHGPKEKCRSGQPDAAHGGCPVRIAASDDLYDAIQDYRHAQNVPPTITATIQQAICEFLTARQFWPRRKRKP